MATRTANQNRHPGAPDMTGTRRSSAEVQAERELKQKKCAAEEAKAKKLREQLRQLEQKMSEHEEEVEEDSCDIEEDRSDAEDRDVQEASGAQVGNAVPVTAGTRVGLGPITKPPVAVPKKKKLSTLDLLILENQKKMKASIAAAAHEKDSGEDEGMIAYLRSLTPNSHPHASTRRSTVLPQRRRRRGQQIWSWWWGWRRRRVPSNGTGQDGREG